jgi:hypothetical protein
MNIAILLHGLTYGGILSLVMFFLIFGSLYYNPEIWLNDYPADIRKKYGPASEKTRKEKRWFSLAVFIVLLGIGAASVAQLPRLTGEQASFVPVFLNLYIIFMVFNLVDLLVFDWLIGVTMRPKFLILRGTEGSEGYRDYGFHFRGFLKGTLISLVTSLILAGVVVLTSAGLGNW